MFIRRFLFSSLAVFAVLSVLFTAPDPTSGRQNAIAALDPVQGLVQWRSANSAEDDWNTVTRAQLVQEGDWIRTDNLGLAYLTFFEGNETEILPDTMVHVARFDWADSDSPDIVIEVSVGSMHHQIEQTLDENARYEVHTPSAVITVRGTDFWNSSTWQSETTVSALTGLVETKGVSEDGTLSSPLFVGQNQSLGVQPTGQLEPLTTLDPANLPQYPFRAPLAPESCGNSICEEGEATVCTLDCVTLTTCGNDICETDAGEGPVTCPADCVPAMRVGVEPSGTSVNPVPPVETNTGEPCTALAQTNSVGIYVGPGFNRTARDYLPTNRSIPVVGQFTDSSSILWYLIQPPGYVRAEANRYWVNAADVTTSGDCANVPDTAASPIVAPTNPEPPTAPNTDPNQPSNPDTPPMSISFYADQYTLDIGQCTTIYWAVEGIREVYYQDVGVVGHSSRLECPESTTKYVLRVLTLDGQTLYRTINITVDMYGY